MLQVANQTVAARQLVADQVTALAESKLKSTLDVSFANVNLADAKLLLVQAQNDLEVRARPISPPPWACPTRRASTVEEEPMPAPLPDQVGDLLQRGHPESPRTEEPAAAGERRRAVHQGGARPVLSQRRRGRDGRIRAGRHRRRARPLRRHRHEHQHSDLQRRPLQGAAGGSRD